MAFSFFKKKKNKGNDDATIAESNGKYLELTVKDIVKETADAITVVFDAPGQAPAYRPGQFLTLIVPIDGQEVRRSYSLCTSPYVDQNMAVTIKRVAGGLMSNYLPDHLKVGDQVKVMEPMGVFVTDYAAANQRHMVMFAGGSGITPMMAIVKSVLNQEPDSLVSLVYANRDLDSIIFKSQIEALEKAYPDTFKAVHILEQAPEGWEGLTGRISKQVLTQVLDIIPKRAASQTSYWMCGPTGMMDSLEALLPSHGVTKEQLHKESFVSTAPQKTEAVAADGDKVVKIIYDNQEHQVTVKPGDTILETALDKGIDLPYSCQSGLCTACRGKCVSGKVKLTEEDGLSEKELAEGYVLTCVGHPETNDVVIEIG